MIPGSITKLYRAIGPHGETRYFETYEEAQAWLNTKRQVEKDSPKMYTSKFDKKKPPTTVKYH